MSIWKKLFGKKNAAENQGGASIQPLRFFIEVETVIERSPEIVWAHFLATDRWQTWWGGGLQAADWREGGRLTWALGGGAPIAAFVAGRLVTIAGTFMDDTFMFEAAGAHRTLVRLGESAPRGGASFNDGGASRRAQLAKVLAKLKQMIEEGKQG